MATITQGMFGMTPEDLMAQRQQALNAQALQYAQLDPAQAAQMSFYKAGSQLGSGLGGLMGAQDPELMRVRQRQQMLQGLDLNNPESLMKKAQEASQMGDYQAAQELAAKAQELAKELSAQKLQAAHAKYYEQGGASKTSASPYGKVLPHKYTSDSFEAFSKSVNEGKPDYSLLDPLDPKEKAAALSPMGKIARDSGFVPGTDEFSAEVKRIQEQANVIKGAPTAFKVAQAEEKKQEQQVAKDAAATSALNDLDIALTNVGEARKRTSPWSTGWGAAAFESLPNSEALALKDIVTSLNSENVMTQMKELKQASKTGATGFGATSVKEVELLESRIRKLNPKSSTFSNDLAFIESSWKNIKNKIEQQRQAPPTSVRTAQTAPAMPKNVDYSAAFERAKKLDPRWAKYTLEQFKQAAGAR